MGYALRQSQTTQPLLFLMVDSADHVTGKTGLSPAVTLSKNGAAFAAPSGAVSELSGGWYKVAGNATDSGTLGPLALHATATGADPYDDVFPVVAYDPLTAKVPATLAAVDVTGNLPANVAQIAGQTANAAAAVTFPAAVGTSTYAGGTVAGVTAPVIVGTNNDKTGYALVTTPPAAAVIAAAVFDLATAGHTNSGTFGAAVVAAGGAGDPWSTALPGSYDTGTAGAIIGGIPAFPANFGALAITAATGLVKVNLAQTGLVPRDLSAVADVNLTLGDAFVCAISGAAGKEAVSGTNYVIKTPSTGTVIRTFALDSATAPTSRT